MKFRKLVDCHEKIFSGPNFFLRTIGSKVCFSRSIRMTVSRKLPEMYGGVGGGDFCILAFSTMDIFLQGVTKNLSVKYALYVEK